MLVCSFTHSPRGKAEESAIPCAEAFLAPYTLGKCYSQCRSPSSPSHLSTAREKHIPCVKGSGYSGSSASHRERCRTEGLLLWFQLSARCFSSKPCLASQAPLLMGHSIFPGASFNAPRWTGHCQETCCLCKEIAQDKLFHSHYRVYAKIGKERKFGCDTYAKKGLCGAHLL